MAEHGSETRGFKEAGRATLDSGLEYAQARTALLRLEALEARAKLKRISLAGMAGLVFFITGYSLLLYLGALAAAHLWLADNWQLALAITAGAHLLLGILLLIAARARTSRANLFAASIQQIERDRQWLQDLQDAMKNRR